MKLFIIFLKIIIVAALLIISNGNLALNKTENKDIFFDRYSDWLSEIFNNGAIVVGYVISTEWLPDKPDNQANESVINIKR